MKYKCHSRYKLLICVEGQIMEIYPNQVVDFPQIMSHPCLRLVVTTTDTKVHKKVYRKKVKDTSGSV